MLLITIRLHRKIVEELLEELLKEVLFSPLQNSMVRL
jgi:hypothetical protein